jgi:DNA-binding MarR family transcriptional regulator
VRPAQPKPSQPSAPALPVAPAAAAQDPLAFQLLNEVGIIDQLAQNRAAKLLGPALNLSQFVVLNHLTRLGGERSLVQIAGAIQVTKGAMTNTVARLQAKGLLDVQADPNDGRGKRVRLTAAGQAARAEAVASLAAGLAELGALATQAELVDALVLLRRLRVWFDSHR